MKYRPQGFRDHWDARTRLDWSPPRRNPKLEESRKHNKMCLVLKKKGRDVYDHAPGTFFLITDHQA